MRNNIHSENSVTPLCPAGHLPLKGGERDGASLSLHTSPLRGEVAAKRRVGVNRAASSTSSIGPDVMHVAPPRSFAPTLPLKGRVSAAVKVEATP